jgi:hypothetical protein
MKRLICLCVAVIVLGAVPAGAMTGNELRNDAHKGGESFSFIHGFIEGTISGFGLCALASTNKNPFCFPKGVTQGQTINVVLKYLDDHPEELHEPASILILKAVKTAWPCKK